MNISMLMCQNTRPLHNIPTSGYDLPLLRSRNQKEKVVVVMGATGTGKSRLSIDLSTHFSAEIINSDKIQAYEGLDIVTNKITEEERCGVPHHLLGIIDPNSDFPVSNFCNLASLAMRSIVGRRKLPIIVGGSNSYIEALVNREDKYECCFLWVDVSPVVLNSFLSQRVDRMVEMGMVDEVRQMFDPKADYRRGIRKAIGVPEFDRYLRFEKSRDGDGDAEISKRLLLDAINETKINTRKLAWRQADKIYRLRNVKGWRIHRLDATEVFRKRGGIDGGAWEEMVVRPSTAIVNRFLNNFGSEMTVARPGTAMATVTH